MLYATLLALTLAQDTPGLDWRTDVAPAIEKARADGKLVMVFITGPKD